MAHLGHLSSSYIQLLGKIHSNKGVPCEWLPELWYPDDIPEPELRSVASKTAKALCKSCPVIKDCLAYAIESSQKHGIWGATEPHER